jgi:hypothetical protein
MDFQRCEGRGSAAGRDVGSLRDWEARRGPPAVERGRDFAPRREQGFPSGWSASCVVFAIVGEYDHEEGKVTGVLTLARARSDARIGMDAMYRVVLVFVMAMLLGAAPASAARWSIQSVVSPSDRGVALFGVSCPSVRVCIAVGGPDNAPRGRLFAERWDGDHWSRLRTPIPHGAENSGLNGVSCVSANACVAVGYFDHKPLAERWNGRRWSLQHLPTPARSYDTPLFAVSCLTGRECMAVGRRTDRNGFNVRPLLERWNGTRWRISGPVPQPYPGDGSELKGVSCTSRFACMAVGDNDNGVGDGPGAIAEQWDGLRWTVHPHVNPAPSDVSTLLFSVSCASSSFCAAVGFENDSSSGGSYPDYPLTEVWNGRRWRIRTKSSRRGQDLYGVSCRSATACLAVGDVVERWNRGRWALQRIPFELNYLVGVACTSKRTCEAVGSRTQHGREVPLAVQWSA